MQPIPLAPARALAPAGRGAIGPRHRSVVAIPQQRPLAPQSPDRRRALLHHRRSSSTSTPATIATCPPPAGCSGRDTSISTSDDVAPVTLPAVVRPPLPTGGGYAFDRLPLDLRRYARLTPSLRVTPGSAPTAGSAATGCRSSAGSRSAAPTCCPASTSAPSLAPRAGSSTRRSPRSATASIATQLEVRTRLGLNLGYRMRDRDSGEGGRFIGIEEADLVFLGDAGKAWLAGDGPGQVPVNRIPVAARVEDRRGDRARRRRRSAPTSRRASARASRCA